MNEWMTAWLDQPHDVKLGMKTPVSAVPGCFVLQSAPVHTTPLMTTNEPAPNLLFHPQCENNDNIIQFLVAYHN